MNLIPGKSKDRNTPTYRNVGRLWVVANRVLYHASCNRVIDVTIEKFLHLRQTFSSGRPSTPTINYVWNHTSKEPNCRYRKLYLDLIFYDRTSAKEWKDSQSNLPKEFFMQLGLRYLDYGTSLIKRLNEMEITCRLYHTHEDGRVCGSYAREGPRGK